MQSQKLNSFGAKWGVIIGFVYCLLLVLRYKMGGSNPIMFSLWIFVGYIVVLVLLLIAGFNLRKEMGGYIELKDAFKALFVAVLIFELFYAIFNFIYIKYVDPGFFQRLKDSTELLLQKSNQSQEKIDKALSSLDVDAAKKMNIWDVLKSYLFFVAISGVFAFLIALIVKRKKDPSLAQQENFLQP
jgi:hypothetical protein